MFLDLKAGKYELLRTYVPGYQVAHMISTPSRLVYHGGYNGLHHRCLVNTYIVSPQAAWTARGVIGLTRSTACCEWFWIR